MVWSGTSRSGVVARTIDASDGVGAVVQRVLPSGGTAIVTGRQRIWTWVWRVIRAYLDGGNGVGKIPPC